MEKPLKQNNKRNFFTSRLFMGLLLVIMTVLMVLYARAYYQDYLITSEIRALEDDIKNLDTKKLDSMKILEYVMKDQFVEDAARVELGLKKEGEKVMALPNTNSIYSAVSTNNRYEDLSTILKWWYYFTKHSIPNNNIF